MLILNDLYNKSTNIIGASFSCWLHLLEAAFSFPYIKVLSLTIDIQVAD